MLLNEIAQVEEWQQTIVPHTRDVNNITNEQLSHIYNLGMIGHAEVNDYRQGQFAELASRIPLTSLTLHAPAISNDYQTHNHWLTAQRVDEMPASITTLHIDGALANRVAQEALFNHPMMEGMAHLHLTPPGSAIPELVNIDLGLAHPPTYGNNPDFDQTTQSLDAGLAGRLTSGKLSKTLQTLKLDYEHLQSDGVRSLLNSDKLHHTVIEISTPEIHRRVRNLDFLRKNRPAAVAQAETNFRQDLAVWSQQVEPQVWLDLAQHNRKAVKAQGGIYELPEHMRQILNDNRSTMQWLRRRVIRTADDLPPLPG
jgi:hypothetical protein